MIPKKQQNSGFQILLSLFISPHICLFTRFNHLTLSLFRFFTVRGCLNFIFDFCIRSHQDFRDLRSYQPKKLVVCFYWPTQARPSRRLFGS